MVPHFPKSKIILIRTPGAGSSSLLVNLSQREEPQWLTCELSHPALSWSKVTSPFHLTARQVRAMWPELYSSCMVVGTIRNPVDWTNSIWRKPNIQETLSEDTSGSYSDYLERLELTPYHWVADENEEIIVHRLYKTEELETVAYPELGLRPPYYKDTVSEKPKATPTADDLVILQMKFDKEYKYYGLDD